jgi:two-component system, NarL family, sensor kinase
MKALIWTRFAIIFLSLLILAPATIFTLLHLTSASDGARLQPGQSNILREGVVVAPLTFQPGGLQQGDIVLAVNGRSLEDLAAGLFTLSSERPSWKMGEQVTYTLFRDGQRLDVPIILGSYPFTQIFRLNWGTILFALVFLGVSAFIFIRRPDNPAVRVLFITASCITSATTWSFGLQVADFVNGAGFWTYKVTTLFIYTLFWVSGFHFSLIFPRPLPLVLKYRRVIPGTYIFALLLVLSWLAVSRLFSSTTLEWLQNWVTVEGMAAGIFLLLALLAFYRQYRSNPSGTKSKQIRWVVWAALLSGSAGLLLYIIPGALGQEAIDPNLAGLIVLPFPLAFAVSILRHNLFEIDRLINRTLVYVLLTAGIAAVYLIVVGALGALFHAWGNLFITLFATILVAILFQPARERVSRWVNRLMYGERDEPFEVIARLGQRLDETVSLQAALPTLVETVAQALKLPYVSLVINTHNGQKSVASYGKPGSSLATYPILNQGETLGKLEAAFRSIEEPFTPEEERLLGSIARQAGTILQTVLLSADLQASRQRLVTAQEEERRRLRRDLHDGLGPTLASHLLKLGAARSLLDRDPALVDRYLGELEQETEDILSEVRRLVYNLRPPTLDQLGLLEAIRTLADQYNQLPPELPRFRIVFDLPEKIPDLPAAVEVAAYRIVQEALNNVVRHAQASCCEIRLRYSDALHLTVTDDGHGFQKNYHPGIGLTTMRERASELGGNLQVSAVNSGGISIRVNLPVEGYHG